MNPRIVLATAACLLALAPASAQVAEGDGGGLYARIVQAYMTGKFDDLDAALAEAAKSKADLAASQQADVQYVRAALAECRPAWWASCKAGKPTRIRQKLFLKGFDVLFDPQANEGVNMSGGPGGMKITVNWKPDEMDSTAEGLYGYQKGDQACVTVWGNLAVGQIYAGLPVATLARMTDRDKLRLNRYMSFRSNLASLYYATPPARRYGLHIYFASFYYDKWGKGPLPGARRAAASLLMAEVLKDPAAWPSLKLPAKLPADRAEEALGQHYKMALKRTALWTIAEDRLFREAVKPFAAANDQTVFKTEKVTLPNKLVVAIDPEADETLRPKRDAWIKEQYDKAQAGR